MAHNDNCGSYVSKGADFIEPGNNEDKTIKNYKPENKSDKITDWLMLFLIMVGLGSIFSVIYPIVTFEFQKYAYLYSLAFADIMIGIGSLLFGIYVIISFNKRSPNAVFLAKSYIGLVLFSNLIFLALDQYEVDGFFNIGQRIRGVAWGIIWGAYFYYSKQVKSLFPKDSRRIYTRDKLILASFIIIPPLFVFVLQPIEYDHKYTNLTIKTINIENRFSVDMPENLHQRNDLGDDFILQYGDMEEELIVTVLEDPHELVENQLKNSLYENIELSISDYYEIVRNKKNYTNKTDTLIQWMPTIIETTKIENLYYVCAYVKGEYGFYQIMSSTTLEKADKLKDKMNKIILSFKEL